jgi:hypothetical protein
MRNPFKELDASSVESGAGRTTWETHFKYQNSEDKDDLKVGNKVDNSSLILITI